MEGSSRPGTDGFYVLSKATLRENKDPDFVSANIDLVKHFNVLDGKEYSAKMRKDLMKSFLDTLNPALVVNLKVCIFLVHCYDIFQARHFRAHQKHKKRDTGLMKFAEAKFGVQVKPETGVKAEADASKVEIKPINELIFRRAFTLQPGKAPKSRKKGKTEGQPGQPQQGTI